MWPQDLIEEVGVRNEWKSEKYITLFANIGQVSVKMLQIGAKNMLNRLQGLL